MFTIFHTADWHLGQSFHGYERHEEHEAFLHWLRQQLLAEQPHALVLAGDVFDTINPSAKSTRMYYGFLADVRREMPELHLVITAGNHDSGSRLEAPADLLSALNIRVVGTIQKDETGAIDLNRLLVPLKSTAGILQAIIIAMPFLRPSDVPKLNEANDAYLDGITDLYQQAFERATQLAASDKIPIIALGHCHVQGGAESPDSERRITIGGSESMSPKAFPADASYVALGHLHKAQKFQSGRICYSGSPIPLSFTERSYEHRIMKASFSESKLADVEGLMIPTAVPLLTVPAKPASLDEVLEQLEQLPDRPKASQSDTSETQSGETQADTTNTDKIQTDAKQAAVGPAAFLEVRVLDDGPDPTRCQKIEDAVHGKHVRLASIKLERPESTSTAEADGVPLSLDELQTIDAEQIFRNAFQEKYDDSPDDSVLTAFREIVAELETNR